MNTETGAIAAEPITEAIKPKFDLRNMTREQIEAAYLESHNGVARAARRHMARDIAKGRIAGDVVRILRGDAT